MPLNSGGLQSALLAQFKAPASSAAGCAQQWADAVGNYASAVAPPSLSVSAARSALAAGLTAAFSSPLAAPGMESAFAAFAATVAAGMAPTFVGAPPPRPVGFAAMFATLSPTHEAAAAAMAALIDSWMRSGTATPSVGGAPVPWQ
jgi:hypothetical protein